MAKRKKVIRPYQNFNPDNYVTARQLVHKFGISADSMNSFTPATYFKNPDSSSVKPLQAWKKQDVDSYIKTRQEKGEEVSPKKRDFYDSRLSYTDAKKRRKQIDKLFDSYDFFNISESEKSSSRSFVIHVGQTNSGKTYHALNAMKTGASGVYLGPLRLLALEIYETMNMDGYPCSLLTGEESDDMPGAKYIASTIEMLDEYSSYDVAVIDEAQMMADRKRGAHWVRAILGVKAREVHICTAPEGLTLIQSLLRSIAEPRNISVQYHDRLVPLEFRGKISGLKDAQPGDAFITFSRKGVLGIAAELENLGFNVSVIYGSLPPASRREEVRKFSSGENSVMVATDAIGMGVSMPIKRIVFCDTYKFNGEESVPLTVSEIKQIAGRAGRFGKYPVGEVVTLTDVDRIEKGLYDVAPAIKNLTVPFPLDALDSEYSVKELLVAWKNRRTVKGIVLEDVSEYLVLLNTLGSFASKLDKRFLYKMISCPVDTKKADTVYYWFSCVRKLYEEVFGGKELSLPELFVTKSNTLEDCEYLYRCLDIRHQLLRRVGVSDDCTKEKTFLTDKINELLSKDKKSYLKRCRSCGKPLPATFRYSVCDKCHYLSMNPWIDF